MMIHGLFYGIVALRNEKGSYNPSSITTTPPAIVALRNEKGSYNAKGWLQKMREIVALRNEKGSYNHRKKSSGRC